MNITCPECSFSKEISEVQLSSETFQVRCPRCRKSFPVTKGPQVAVISPFKDDASPAMTMIECPKCSESQANGEVCIRCGVIFRKIQPRESVIDELPNTMISHPDTSVQSREEAGWMNIVNIIALFFLLCSTITLLTQVSGLNEVIGYWNRLSFYQKAKPFYDVLMAAGLFVTSFGLSMKKEWSRITMIVLLSLGLAEMLYMLINEHVVIAQLEKHMQESFSELRRNNTGYLVGCFVYAFFIIKLNSRSVRARFRPA
jgi:predicted Zn finger-like uncharacterized protein